MKTPLLIGLTGSIGMGKSTVAGFFAEAGVPVWDADAAVHRLYAAGAAGANAIAFLCPEAIKTNGVDRTTLSDAISKDETLLPKVEAAIHPLVTEDRKAFIKTLDNDLAVFDIPLLFETNGTAQFDTIVVVSAPPDMQRERVLARSGMTEEKFASILSRQMPDVEKRKKADHVIDTGRSLSQTRNQVVQLIKMLRQ